jgi:hypothetical protein
VVKRRSGISRRSARVALTDTAAVTVGVEEAVALVEAEAAMAVATDREVAEDATSRSLLVSQRRTNRSRVTITNSETV